MKTPRYHRCEICLKIYCCPQCFSIVEGNKNARLYGQGQGVNDAYACDFTCTDCREEKAS